MSGRRFCATDYVNYNQYDFDTEMYGEPLLCFFKDDR